MWRAWQAVVYGAVALLCGACATGSGASDVRTIDAALRARTAAGIRLDEAARLPAAVTLDDGLTVQETVSIALWNNPAYRVALADAGLAGADLVQARQIPNPILSLLFPWGPKQFEASLQWPVEALWQRPKRVKAATLDVDAVASRLVSDGLGVMAQARAAYVGATAAADRLRLARESSTLWGQLRTIADARLREGDISDLEARSVRSEADMATALVRAAEGDVALARIELQALLGYVAPPAMTLTAVDRLPVSTCGGDALLSEALASRPDVRAAELGIEAAGVRAGLERARILNLSAILDANGQGLEGFEAGPGLLFEVPLNRNAGNRARAAAALTQASRRYVAVRTAVRAEIDAAMAREHRARDVLRAWDDDILASLEIEEQQARKAYEAGETPLFVVLDVGRRTVAARRARLDAWVDRLNAAIALDRAVGRSCAFE